MNTEVTEALQLTISDWLTELVNINNEKKLSSNLLDLYCGAGTIGIYLADNFEMVRGIEINEDAVNSANLNKKINVKRRKSKYIN